MSTDERNTPVKGYEKGCKHVFNKPDALCYLREGDRALTKDRLRCATCGRFKDKLDKAITGELKASIDSVRMKT